MKILKPLRWPEGWKRTPAEERLTDAPASCVNSMDQIADMLRVFSAYDIVATLNVDTNGDPGVSVYFSSNQRPYVVASDSYTSSGENFAAICEVVESLRDLLTCGEDIQDRALQGFTELPPAKAGIEWPLHWSRIIGTLPDWDRLMPETQRRWIEQRYGELVKASGSEQAMRDLRQARVEAFADVGSFVMREKE